jgi:hypothetical protein
VAKRVAAMKATVFFMGFSCLPKVAVNVAMP